MTYVELIVVLSIFAVMSSIALFNYRDFQAKVDIKNLANDVALKLVEAQKSAIFGVFPSLAQQALMSDVDTWKPSYGVYFNTNVDNTNFVYFVDADNTHTYQNSGCSGECIENVSIQRGNTIQRIDVFYSGDNTAHEFTNVHITFTRPNLGAIFYSTLGVISNVYYAQITVAAPNGYDSIIKVYNSGRIQIN